MQLSYFYQTTILIILYFLYFGWLTRKENKKQKTDLRIEKQRFKTTQINDDSITTKRPAANTRLCSLAG